MSDRDRLRRLLAAHGPALLLALGALAVYAVNTRVVFASLRGASFHNDAWEMIDDGRTWRGLFASEWRHVLDGRDRFRPTTHLMFALYVRCFGVDAEGFARLLWGLVAAAQAAQGVYLTRLGLRAETALLTVVFTTFSAAYLGTTYAHQYNDLVLAALFTFATLNLCLRPAPPPAWRPALLLALGVGAHESAVLCGPMLVLSLALVRGPGAWRAWTARPEARAVVAISVGYALLRLTGGAAVNSGLVSSTPVARNYAWLLAELSDELVHPPERLALLLGGARSVAVVLSRRPQFVLVPLALLALGRGPDPRRALRYAAFAAAWVLVTYAPFALNPRYGSVTYVCVTMLLPAAALLHPTVEWVSAWRRPWLRALALLGLLALVYPVGIRVRLRFSDRLAGPLLRAVVARAAAVPRAVPLGVWVVENQPAANSWGRSPVEEELQLMPTHESLAVRQLVPGRFVRVTVLNAADAAAVRPRPTDLVLAAEGRIPRYRVWEFPPGGGAPRLIFGERAPGLTPPPYAFAPPAP